MRIYQIDTDRDGITDASDKVCYSSYKVSAEWFTEAVKKVGKELANGETIRQVLLLAATKDGD